MKSGTQVALAVGAGYVLGRRRKARLALMLGGAAATGGFGGVTRQLLKRGTHLVGSSDALGKISPELGEVTDMIRGDLVDVGKAAALTAVRGRIDRMSDRLADRASTLRSFAENGAGEEEPRDEAGPADEAEGAEPEDYAENGEDEEFDEDEEAADARDYDEEADFEEPGDAEDLEEDEDEDEDEDDAEVVSAGSGRRARSSSGGSPIRRTRR